VDFALHHLGMHVDGEEVLLHEEVDDVGVLGVDEGDHGRLLRQPRRLVALAGPDLGKAYTVLGRPLSFLRVSERVHGELRCAALALERTAHLETTELAIADLHAAAGGALSLGAVAASVTGPAVFACFRERHEGHVRLVGEGVAGGPWRGRPTRACRRGR